jgi:hypothetical protein
MVVPNHHVLLAGSVRSHSILVFGDAGYRLTSVKGQCCDLSRAIDRGRNLVDVRLSEIRYLSSAEAFFRSAWELTGVMRSHITSAGHDTYPRPIQNFFGGQAAHWINSYLNTHPGQDHRGIRQCHRPITGLQTLATAARFCHLFDELRRFLRPQPHRNQPLKLELRRASIESDVPMGWRSRQHKQSLSDHAHTLTLVVRRLT